MSPPGGEIEIAIVGIELAGGGGEHADDAKLRTDWRYGDAWNALFGIEQRRDLTPERGGGLERGGTGGQRDAGPVRQRAPEFSVR